ncbi:hypothetical protein Ancab_019844 [Ancistrocladus abbreviatus]
MNPMVKVSIHNWLAPNHTLDAHCKSHEHDLQNQQIQCHAGFDWSVDVTAINNRHLKVYNCHLKWGHKHLEYVAFSSHAVFIERCGGYTECKWNATNDGLIGKSFARHVRPNKREVVQSRDNQPAGADDGSGWH